MVGADDYVALIAAETTVSGAIESRRPTVDPSVQFSVSWPGSQNFPWMEYNALARADDGEDIRPAYQLLRKLLIAFRSFGYGELKRYAPKIENRRLTRNDLGLALRARLLKDGVLALDGKYYALDANRLGELLGIDYNIIARGETSERCNAYLAAIVRELPND